MEEYHFFGSHETGVGYSMSFDNGKPVNFYISAPIQFWKIWEYSIGVDININGYRGGFYVGSEGGISMHTPKASFDVSKNIRGQISFKNSWVTDNGTYAYNKVSVNTLEIGLTVAGLAAVPASSLIAAGATTGAIFASAVLIISALKDKLGGLDGSKY